MEFRSGIPKAESCLLPALIESPPVVVGAAPIEEMCSRTASTLEHQVQLHCTFVVAVDVVNDFTITLIDFRLAYGILRQGTKRDIRDLDLDITRPWTA